MKTKDVRLNETYHTKVAGDGLVAVIAYARDESGKQTRWRVKRVDNERPLPKSRTAAALRFIPGRAYVL